MCDIRMCATHISRTISRTVSETISSSTTARNDKGLIQRETAPGEDGSRDAAPVARGCRRQAQSDTVTDSVTVMTHARDSDSVVNLEPRTREVERRYDSYLRAN